MQIKKIFLIFLEIVTIILLTSLILSYLSLVIVDWPYPDETFQYSFVKKHGLLGAIFGNWCCVSLGRPTGVAWIDIWMWIFQILNIDSILVFAFYKFITFVVIIFSIFYFTKFFFSFLKFNQKLILTLLFYSIFIQSYGADQFLSVYGLDLALYGIPIFYSVFFIIYALKVHNLHNFSRKNIFLYYFFLILYLNISYAHLVTGGLFIYFVSFKTKQFHSHIFNPLKNFKLIFFNNFFLKNYIFFKKNNISLNQNNIFAFAFFLFFTSCLIHLLSPSLFIREKIWPSDTSLLLGLLNSIPVLEGLIFYGWGYLYISISLIVCFLSLKNKIFIEQYSIYLRILIIIMTPIIVIVTNGLAFTSTTLQGAGVTVGFQGWEQSLFFFDNLFKEFEYNHATSARHLFYFNHLAVISYFFLGLELSNYLKKLLRRVSFR
jgi:hypothetical protein